MRTITVEALGGWWMEEEATEGAQATRRGHDFEIGINTAFFYT
jgi:hypothetical protein